VYAVIRSYRYSVTPTADPKLQAQPHSLNDQSELRLWRVHTFTTSNVELQLAPIPLELILLSLLQLSYPPSDGFDPPRSPHGELSAMAPHVGFDTEQIRDKARKDLLYLLEGVSKASLSVPTCYVR
jgi:hypothetical protein